MLQRTMSRDQKFVALAVVLPSLSALGYLFLAGNFMPEEKLGRSSFFSSIVLVALSVAVLMVLKRQRRWQPAPAWSRIRASHKVFAILGSPVILTAVLWGNLANVLPYLVAVTLGGPGYEKVAVEKSRNLGRSFCDYEVTVKSGWRGSFFRWCISAEQFERMPEGEFLGKFVGKRGNFGIIAKGFGLGG